jgi:dinuclear metal center YbgI/SA1388 family protein
MVSRGELEAWLNEYLGVGEIADFLPNGLQIEGSARIDSIVTAVSINLEVIEAAVREGASVIVVHHGLFWKNDEPVIRGYRKERFRLLLQNEINLFCFHLPLDLHPEVSHNRLILEGLGAEIPEGSGTSNPVGLEGRFPEPLPLEELVRRVDDLLGTEARCFPFGKEAVGSLFVVSGGGRNELEEVLTLGVDAFLTGDARENTVYVAREAGINYLCAGHYNTEKPGIIELGKRIERQFDVEVRFVDVENPL